MNVNKMTKSELRALALELAVSIAVTRVPKGKRAYSNRSIRKALENGGKAVALPQESDAQQR